MKKTRPPVKLKSAQSRQAAFLAAYAETASITLAAKAAKVARRTHYEWIENEAYVLAFARAGDQAAQVLEDEAVRRAKDGVEEPKFFKGQLCYRKKWNEELQEYEPYGKPLSITRYSDALMLTLLKRFRPELYRDRAEVTGAGGGPLVEALTVTFVKPK